MRRRRGCRLASYASIDAKAKAKILRAKRWEFGIVKDFLGLSNEESAYIELKLSSPRG
jgi:hypothetical protein